MWLSFTTDRCSEDKQLRLKGRGRDNDYTSRGDVSMVNLTGAAWPQLQSLSVICREGSLQGDLVFISNSFFTLEQGSGPVHILSLRWTTGFKMESLLLFLHWLQQRHLGARFCLLASQWFSQRWFLLQFASHTCQEVLSSWWEKPGPGQTVSWRYYHQTHSTDNLYTAPAYNRYL